MTWGRQIVLVTFLACCGACSSAQGIQRVLPPCADPLPRTREEWDAHRAYVESLPGPHFKDAYPDYANEFDALMERLPPLFEKYTGDDVVYDSVLGGRTRCGAVCGQRMPASQHDSAKYPHRHHRAGRTVAGGPPAGAGATTPRGWCAGVSWGRRRSIHAGRPGQRCDHAGQAGH